MINTYFISDLHLGHKNILEFEKEFRPFSSLEEMHAVIIERWNDVVKPQDIVYILGDFCFGRHNIRLAGLLNGRKRLVMGNHDKYPAAEYLEYFEKLYGVIFWQQCILSHVPVHPNQFGHRWHLNAHGHTHSRKVKALKYGGIIDGLEEEFYIEIEDKRFFNVSCELHNLTPVHSDVIIQRLRKVKINEM